MAKNDVLSVRLDANMRRRLEEFRVTSGFENLTQAARAVMMVGLNKTDQLDGVFRQAATIEAAKSISRRIRENLQQVISELGDG